MNKYVFEILEEVGKQRNRNDKVKILKQHESWALKDVIRGSMDSTVVWNLPEGQPPYTPSPAHHHPANLIRENTKFKYFVKGGQGDKMLKVKREQMFIQMLESVSPEEAELLIKMKEKKLKITGLSYNLVKEVFPHLLP